MKRPLVLFTLLALLLVGGIHLSLLFTPPSAKREWREVAAQEGAPFQEIARRMEEAGIVRSRHLMTLLARYEGITRNVRRGVYALHTRMTVWDVLEALKSGKVIEYQVVIPEGYTAGQIGRLLEDVGFTERRTFLRWVRDPAFAESLLGVPARSLEGFLFPDTYYFPKGEPVEQAIRQMVRRYREVFAPQWLAEAEAMGMTEHQVVTLASIIERETGIPEERPLVSAVFHNRLRKGMPLQADPTVIYGLILAGSFDGNLLKEDLRHPSPYNTYRHKGLPPGPIANPGKAALEAALRPAKVSYLYFVSKNDSTHYFSETLREHNRAVAKYQMRTSPAKVRGEAG